MTKKRQFIDKNNCQRFSLNPNISCRGSNEISNDLEERKDLKKDLIKYGIYYDDNYNYLQHLKSSSDATNELIEVYRIEKVPTSSANLQSDDNATRKQDIVPELAETFNDAFDFDNPDNLLEDDFIQMANGDIEMAEEKSGTSSFCEDDEEISNSGSLKYECNENSDLLNERFEKLYQSYKNHDIGALDDLDVDENGLDNDYILENILKSSSLLPDKDLTKSDPNTKVICINKYLYEKSSCSSQDSEYSDDEVLKETWDCESILSKPKDMKFQPNLIKDPFKTQIKVSKKGVPIDYPNDLKLNRLNPHNVHQLEDQKPPSSQETTSNHVIEDRSLNKLRKRSIKLEKKERRAEKKSNKNAFRQEHIKTNLQLLNIATNHPNAIKIP